MAIMNVSDDTFETEVLNAAGPVLVDYWAEWCGPCKQIAPMLDDVARDMGEKVQVAKVNIDENPKSPQKYGVRGIPTLMLFKDGQVAATRVGAMSKSALTEWIDSVV
ncbi:MAG: thioredoxin TrxA [Pseudomonadota bacterium]